MGKVEKLIGSESPLEIGQKINEIIEKGVGGGYKTGQVVLFDHKLNYEESEGFEQLGTYLYKEAIAGSRYGYPDFYENRLKEYQEATADGIFLTHENGHVFYDIANKSQVDAIYEATGIAWAYGIDTANERIFLPRNDYYPNDRAIPLEGSENLDWTKVETVTSLPYTVKREGWWLHYGVNKTGMVAINGVIVDHYTWANNNWPGHQSVQIKLKPGDVVSLVQQEAPATMMFIPFEAVKDTTELKQNKNSYMVVGNTANEEALTDVIDITTTENDTLPLFYNTYSQQDMTSTGAFVNASLGNYLDGKVWTTAYAEIEKMGIGAKFDAGTIKAYGDSTITDYDLVLNQSNMTFRLPLLNGGEELPSDKNDDLALEASGTKYTAPENGWYFVWKAASAAGQYLALTNENTRMADIIYSVAADQCRGKIFAKKGDIIKVEYTLAAETRAFRFIHAQGNGNLYYKLNNVVQNQQMLDLAGVASVLSKKVSADNLVETPVIVECYNLTGAGYIVYSNGLCWQWGNGTAPSTANTWGTKVTLYKKHAVNSYRIFLTNHGNTSTAGALKFRGETKTESSFEVASSVQGTAFQWITFGQLAEGEY